jgi:hypothetical protein
VVIFLIGTHRKKFHGKEGFEMGQRRLFVFLTICGFSLLFFACGTATGETPTDSFSPPATPEKGKCGDGVCDEMEQKNPDLCPQDCYTPGILETSEGNGTGMESWFGSGSWTCLVDKGEAGQDSFSAEFEIDFSVAPNGSITGSGWGVFTSAVCQLAGCTCEFDPGELTVSVGGKKVDGNLNLQIHPKAPMTQTATCPNSGTTITDMAGLLPGCQPATGGLSDFTIEAVEGATHTFSGGLTENITGEGSVVIHLKNE